MLGSVASGMLIGLCGAVMIVAVGHPLGIALLTYAILGSLGTLFVAALSMQRGIDRRASQH
jgi:hypothetical protein